MTQPPTDEKRKPVRRPRLNLPFDNRREDAGTWAYEHRIGLCVTLIAYLLLMIVFVSSKIVIGRRASTQGMYIDVETLTELEQERDRLEEEVRRRQEQQEPVDWRSIRNRVSNENALLDEQLRDDHQRHAERGARHPVRCRLLLSHYSSTSLRRLTNSLSRALCLSALTL